MKILGLTALLLLSVGQVKAEELPDSYFAQGLIPAMAKWLNFDDTYGESANTIYESTFYRDGLALAVDQLLAQGKWSAYKSFSYNTDYDFFIPRIVSDVQIGQAPKISKRICSQCFIFVAKTADVSQNLVLFVAGEYISIYYRYGSDDERNLQALRVAEEFQADLKGALKAGLVYKNGVLEYTGDVHFLPGVDDLKFTWNDFIFPQASKNRIQRTIDEFINEYDEETWSHYGLPLNRGVLLYGPPGTGKSFIAKIIASNILNKRYKNKVSYIHVSARHINYVQAVRDLYQVARDLAPSVVFFEDIDLIAGTDRSDRADVKNELMQQLSGIETLKGVITIGTTNVAERIDQALKRSKRLGFQFEIGMPKVEERMRLFQIYLAGVDVDSNGLASWATGTEGFTGADIKELCDMAIEKALNEKSFVPGTHRVRVLNAHIEAAYQEKSKNHVHPHNGGGR